MMNVVVISDPNGAKEQMLSARNDGAIAFVFERADPFHQVCSDPFLRVRSTKELNEKLRLIEADPTVADELRKLQ